MFAKHKFCIHPFNLNLKTTNDLDGRFVSCSNYGLIRNLCSGHAIQNVTLLYVQLQFDITFIECAHEDDFISDHYYINENFVGHILFL